MGCRNSRRAADALPFLLLFSGACTTLGPTPAMSGLPAPPIERPGLELQAGVVPGYYLSSAVQEEPKPAGIPQLAGVIEPDRLINLPGVFAGARYAGEASEGAALEPLIGYRAFLDDDKRFSFAGLGFVAYATADEQAASFSALRGGGELGADVRITPRSRILELHLNLGFTLTALDVDGSYCVDSAGQFGIDCATAPEERRPIAASAGGVYPSAHGGVSVDFARHLAGVFHGGRLALDLASGSMPTVVAGEQRDAHWWAAAGVSLSVGFGAASAAEDEVAVRVPLP